MVDEPKRRAEAGEDAKPAKKAKAAEGVAKNQEGSNGRKKTGKKAERIKRKNMGQKVHPYGFRLGVNKPWRSRWFSSATMTSFWSRT